MWRRLLVLDLVLAAVLVAGVLRVQRSWNEFEASHRVESVRPETETVRTLPATTVIASKPQDWTEISVQDPFSFDRNDVAIVAPKQQATPAEPKPVLFGTMSVGNEWIAMLGQAGTRISRPVKVGESMGTWQVVEIRENAVVVVANGLRETVVMNDPLAQVPRDYSRTLSAASSPAQSNVVSPSVTAPAAPPAANAPASPASTGQAAPAAAPADDILQTPFGPVKRTKP